MDWLRKILWFGRVAVMDDSGDYQRLQLVQRASGNGGTERVTDRVLRMVQFGFTSAPPNDADVLVLNRNGEAALGIAIATAHRDSRPRDLKAGDSAIYDVRGRIIRLTADGIEIDAAGGDVLVTNAAKVRCTCDVETTGDVISRADGKAVSLNALHDTFNLHNHPPVVAGGSWGSGPPKPQA
ncbi:phage baseplate assembly protein [uncultured Sphingomonas sp.]|uniref:phage baseplate assembly protein domain-containing protein n=1 Tax=uncultured Sphingomonas sp. TaxID=158754 RepID=UPI002599CD07|nr:phage baseplate assembly protein [uncultured Sphingomonas sp.]